MKQQLTLGSLFDGIGGWQLAAVRAGIVPIWSSEIEAFPVEVTRRHFHDTLQLGDVTKIDGGNIPPVDIICAGSPCQDLSVAGKRTGLAGERSGLFVRAVDIVRQMRRATDGEKPRFFVWENVPGAFSSNHRQDFRAVLTEIGEAEIPMPRSGRWADAGLVRTASATSHGACSTLNIGEFPRDASASSLSQILQKREDVPQKYFLSPRACKGILRRAKERGKELPPELKAALEQQASD